MEAEIIIWKKNFESRLAGIRIEFDSFFLMRDMSDFYSIETDLGNQGITLHISANSQLPKQIEEALIKAFADSRPL